MYSVFQLNVLVIIRTLSLVRKISHKIDVPTIVSTFNILNDSCCNLSQIRKHILPMSKIQNVNLDRILPRIK